MALDGWCVQARRSTWVTSSQPVPFERAEAATAYVEEDVSPPSDQTRRVAVWFNRTADNKLTYHVRFPDARFDMQDGYLRRAILPGPADTDSYDEMRLLLPLQYLVESTFAGQVAAHLGKSLSHDVFLIRLPYPRLFYGSDEHTLATVALRFAVGFSVPFSALVVKLVREKRAGTKDVLLHAGMSGGSYLMGHVYEAGFVMGCAILLMCVPLFVYRNAGGTALLHYVDPEFLVICLVVFAVLTIEHAMLLSVFLWNPSVAFAASAIYWILLGLVPYALVHNFFGLGFYYLTSKPVRVASACSPVMYLLWCLNAIEHYEKYEAELTWKDYLEHKVTGDATSIGVLTLGSTLMALVMVVVTRYLDKVVPSGNGVPKPFYYLLSWDYWCPRKQWDVSGVSFDQDPRYFEPHLHEAEPVAHLVNVSAKGKDGAELKDVNLAIFKRQVTVILGPPKCGSSTIVDVLTGMVLPTSGEAYVNGFDATSSSSQAWEYCCAMPHERTLFYDLTVEENMLIYASTLRQLSWNDTEQSVDWALKIMAMDNDRGTLVSQLSPRMRRMLCLSITLCCLYQTPLMIFNDPTRLNDPTNRQLIRDALVMSGFNSGVLVPMRSIEDAEVVADCVVIMREGRVVCAGSPDWLKANFYSGYFLRLKKLPNFREDDVKRVVQHYMGGVEPERVTKIETVYNLRDAEQKADRVAQVLTYLDAQRSGLGIATMSLTTCLLEDICYKMTSGPDLQSRTGSGDTRTSDALARLELARDKEAMATAKDLCSARCSKTSASSLLWVLLVKRALMWRRVCWTKAFTLAIPLLSMAMLVLCERLFLPVLATQKANLTYVPETFFDTVSGFIEVQKDRRSMKFAEEVLAPLMAEHNVMVFSPTGNSLESDLSRMASYHLHSYIIEQQFGISLLRLNNGRLPVYLWYNGQCAHSASVVTSLFHTALLRNLTRKKEPLVTLVNSPLVVANGTGDVTQFERVNGRLSLPAGPHSQGYESELFATRAATTRVLYSLFLSLAMSSHVAGHVVLPMVERESGLKNLQLMSGMSGCLYWMGHFLFDFFTAVWTSVLLALLIYLNHADMDLVYHVSILILFLANAFTSLPLAYLVSAMFRSTSRAFSFFAIALFFAGITGSLSAEILRLLAKSNGTTVASVAIFVWGLFCRWFPTYSLVRAVVQQLMLYRHNSICQNEDELLAKACQHSYFVDHERISQCCRALSDNDTARTVYPLEPFKDSGFYDLASLLAVGTFFLIVLALLDSQLAYRLRWCVVRRLLGNKRAHGSTQPTRGPRVVDTPMDPDLEREVNLVENVCSNGNFKDVAMAIDNIRMSIGFNQPVSVLDGVSLTLRRGECLGIAGVNNSGKTTLLEILAGSVVPTGGDAYTQAEALGADVRSWQRGIGYAPEGLSAESMPPLTVAELLDLVAAVRGVEPRQVAVKAVLDLVGLLDKDQMIDKCSHGETKLLLLACAAVGLPPVLFLDEPLSDVQPPYRHEVIRALQVLRSTRATSIIITSYRMSLCELVCDRVAVIKAAKVEALGDAEEMNQKYGRCYTVTVRLPPGRHYDYDLQSGVLLKVQEEFHEAALQQLYEGVMKFRVGKSYTSWAEIFTKMTAIKRDLRLPEMSISDITLEEILVGLARRQIVLRGTRPSRSVAPPRV
ncbi:phospholipid-transporting ATPase ABCA3-like [Haemaphysalis longicornis]